MDTLSPRDKALLCMLTNQLDILFVQNVTLKDLRNIVKSSDYLNEYFYSNFGDNYFVLQLNIFKKLYTKCNVSTATLERFLPELHYGWYIDFSNGKGLGRINIKTKDLQSIDGKPAVVFQKRQYCLELYMVSGQLICSSTEPGAIFYRGFGKIQGDMIFFSVSPTYGHYVCKRCSFSPELKEVMYFDPDGKCRRSDIITDDCTIKECIDLNKHYTKIEYISPENSLILDYITSKIILNDKVLLSLTEADILQILEPFKLKKRFFDRAKKQIETVIEKSSGGV